MSVVEEGVLFVQSGDVISGTVTDGQVLSAVLFGGFVGNEVWAAIVESGGTLVAADVVNFGGIGVATGGVAIDTVVSDGLLAVEGVASNTLVLNSGTEEVAGGGVTIGTTDSGGLLWVFSGAVASATTVVSGGVETVLAGALAGDTTVGAGGEEVIRTSGVAGSVTVLSGGTLALNGT